jgi:hypothetical protein
MASWAYASGLAGHTYAMNRAQLLTHISLAINTVSFHMECPCLSASAALDLWISLHVVSFAAAWFHFTSNVSWPLIC